MKRNIITVALLAVLATMAVGCQKENIVEQQPTVADIFTARTVRYTVDGVASQITLHSDAEWDAFVDSMLALAAQGHEVQFADESASVQTLPSKEVLTYKTTDPEDAKKWAKEKANQGYTISTTYADGVYYIIAIKK